MILPLQAASASRRVCTTLVALKGLIKILKNMDDSLQTRQHTQEQVQRKKSFKKTRLLGMFGI